MNNCISGMFLKCCFYQAPTRIVHGKGRKTLWDQELGQNEHGLHNSTPKTNYGASPNSYVPKVLLSTFLKVCLLNPKEEFRTLRLGERGEFWQPPSCQRPEAKATPLPSLRLRLHSKPRCMDWAISLIIIGFAPRCTAC